MCDTITIPFIKIPENNLGALLRGSHSERNSFQFLVVDSKQILYPICHDPMSILLAWMTLLMQGNIHDPYIDRYELISERKQSLGDVPIVHSRQVDTNYPSRFRPDPLMIHHTIDYRRNLLPDIADRDAHLYIVAPLQGAVVPIVEMNEKDKKHYENGSPLDIMQYLQSGGLHHHGTRGPRDASGNYVIAGHTSYLSHLPGRHKTTMQFIALMQPGDPLWLYDQLDDGSWQRYRFHVSRSFETDPSDVSILSQPSSGHQLTLYGCYPFGTLDKRRVVSSILDSP